MAARIEPLLTIADLDSCPDDTNRYELIDGELFVARAPGIPHQRVLNNLQIALGNYLRANPVGIIVPGAGAIFSNHDAVIPDLVFVRNERWPEVVSNNKFTAGLDLVIEILSPGKENGERDLLVKRQLYAKFNIGEYWIVDSENRSVEVYKLEVNRLQKVSTFRDSEEITTELLPGFRLSVSAVFNLKCFPL
jgi:Uma2 family endonuclease